MQEWGLCITVKWSARLPLWVKSGHWSVPALCPLYPQKRTLETAARLRQSWQLEAVRRPAASDLAAVRAGRVRPRRRRPGGVALYLTGLVRPFWRGIGSSGSWSDTDRACP